MPAGRKAFDERIRDISPTFLKRHHSIITDDGNSSEAVSALRAVYIDEDERWRTADANSNHVDAISTMPDDLLENRYNRYVISGPARAYSQCTIEPQLPVKVSEGGRMVNGVIRLQGQRAMLTAAAGLSAQVTVAAGNEALDCISNSTSDTALRLYVFGKQLTTNASKISYADLNGTTQATFRDIDSTAAIVYTEIYGAIMVSTADDDLGKCNGTLTNAVGTVIIENVTTGTDLVTFTAATHSARGVQTVAAANRENTRGRHALVDFSALNAGDDVMIIGYSSYGVLQHEILTQAAGYGLRRETANRYQSIIYVATAGTDAARTVAVTGYDSNVFKEALQNSIGNASNYTELNCTQAAGVINIFSDQADDDCIITIVGVNATTVVTEEITANGTTDSAGSSDFTTVYGAYLTQVTTGTTPGVITVERTDAATKMFDFDTNAANTVGILEVTGSSQSVGPSAYSTYDLCGANARCTLTNSNTAGTDSVVVIGENEVGTATTELAVMVAGVIELANEYSRITCMAALHFTNTEYLKLSVEQEDDAAQFCGKAVSSADAQGTIIHIRFKPSVNKARGITERSIIQQIVGSTGVTNLDTLATTTRTITWPDLSGTPALTAYTISKPATIKTIGTGCDYTTFKAAITGASNGDTLWSFLSSDTITAASCDFSKRLTVIGFGDGGTTITSALAGDATVDVTVAACEFHNINFTNSNDGAGDIACFVNNVGARFYNCEFDGGANAAGIALDINANGADYVEFYGCTIDDGIIDADGNALSIITFSDGSTADAVHLDTGTYYIDNFSIAGLLTTGAAAKASVYLNSCPIGGALTITDATEFQAIDSNVTGAFTNTASDLTKIADCDITGAASIVAGTYIDITNVRFGAGVDMSGAVTEAYLRDCDITTTFGMNTAAQAVYMYNSIIGGNATIFHANAAFEAYNCQFGANLVSTDSNVFTIDGGRVVGDLTLTAGTVHSLSDFDVGGNTSLVASTYADFNNIKFTGTFAQTGAVTEAYFYDCDFASTFDMSTADAAIKMYDSIITGVATINRAGSEFSAYNTEFGNNLDNTTSTSLTVKGGLVAGATTLTAGSLHVISDATLTGNVSLVDSTYAEFNSVIFSGTVGITGTVTESFFRDCDFASTFDMNTAAQMAELHNCNVTGVATIFHANADFEAHDCTFGNNLVSTDSNVFRVKGGNVVGALTLTDGTLFEISDATVTGAASLVATTYADFSNVRFGNNFAQSGIVTEAYLRDCDITGTFGMGTAAATMELLNTRITGAITINQAGANLSAYSCFFVSTSGITDCNNLYAHNTTFGDDVTLTDNTISEFKSCSFIGDLDTTATGTLKLWDCIVTQASIWNNATLVIEATDCRFVAALTVTDSSTEIWRDCQFHTFTSTSTATSSQFYDPQITTGDFTINNAAIVVDIHGGNFDQELVITDAATVICKGVHFAGNGTDAITIVDVQTAAYFYDCDVLDAFTITDATLVELHHCTLEDFTDNDTDDINIYSCTFTGAVVPDSADWDSYDSHYLSTVTESAATAVDFWGGSIIGTLTQAAGTVNVYGTRLHADYVGTVGGTHTYSIPTDHYTIGANQMFTTVDLAVASIAANDTYHLPDQSYTVGTPSLVISQQTAWYGEGESTTITDAITADAVVDVTVAGCQFHNIHFTNTLSDASTATALKMDNVGGEFHNCTFDGGTDAANLALDLDANGADTTTFYDCLFPDGKIDANGHGSSIAEFHNCGIGDAVEIDTGVYIFRDCDFGGAITSATAGTLHFYNCTFAGVVTVAAGVTAYFYACDNNSTIDIAPTGIAYIHGGDPGTVDGPVVNQSYYRDNDGAATYYRRFDFTGDTMDVELNSTTGGGTAPVISAPVQGGALIGATQGAGADTIQLDTGANGTWHSPLYHAGMEVEFEIDSVAIIDLQIGFYDDAGDYAYLDVDVTNLGDAEPHTATNIGAAGEVSTDAAGFGAISQDTRYRFKVQMMDDGSAKFYIDDVLVGTSGAAALDNNPATALFMPRIYLAEQGAAVKTLTIDYLEYWGDRA